MTLSMVFYFMQQDVDLVAKDYYRQEIQYQDQIDKITNARSLKEPVNFEYLAQENMIKIHFPSAHVQGGISGTIELYRPSNANEDRLVQVKPSSDGKQLIKVGDLSLGFWKIKISWSSGGKDYYDEHIVTL
jgi:hypothetical protein